MGIRGWFSGRKSGVSVSQEMPVPQPAERRFATGAAVFDLAATEQLRTLFAVDPATRDQAWYDRFWNAAWTAALVVPDPPVFTGPDGMAYLRLELPGDAAAFEANSLMNVAGSMVEQGVGAALFASADVTADEPAYVMSMGVLDSILRFDCPDGEPFEIAEALEPPPADQIETRVAGVAERSTLKAGQEILVGTPSEQYLSVPAARALYRHLVEGWGMADPRVALIVVPAMRPTRSLVIGKSVAEFLREGVDEALMAERVRMLSWYLPPSRRLMLMPDDWSAEDMTRLADLCGSR